LWLYYCLKKLNLSFELQVLDVLGRTVFCQANRVNCMLNAGKLTRLLPAWGDVQLSGGWSQFWGEARKVAKALVKQPNRECVSHALVCIQQSLHPEVEEQRGWHALLDQSQLHGDDDDDDEAASQENVQC
jgi:hypothetical protein